MPPALSSSSSSQQDINPSRKVKRLRELALKGPSQSSTEFHLSMLTHTSETESRQQSPPPTTAPRRRGRKPSGPLSKSAREQLRKTNHSVIEKRRREKINEALAALRHLVPNEKISDADKKDKEDKEFKLEILIRTVDYLRSIMDKIKGLEQGLCRRCGDELLPSTTTVTSTSSQKKPLAVCEKGHDLGRKRKLSEVEEDDLDDNLNLESDFEDQSSEPHGHGSGIDISDVPSKAAIPDTRSTCLPSISSWLSGSPTSSPILQLPSPPQSVPFAPVTITPGSLPGLTLPPPIGFSPTGTSHSSPSPLTRSYSVPSSTSCSPNILPTAHGHAISRILNPHNLTTSPVLLPSPTSPYHPSQLGTKGYNLPRSTSPLTLNPGHHQKVRQQASQDCPPRKWSGDEHTAASLLLNMSSRRFSSSSGSDENGANDLSSDVAHIRPRHPLQAQTPSSLLGMPSGA
ncbi:hypothetical protein Clacol_008944 [Clathrus columnatus]|uniref:BHLH domain-containing protein n=1 Tax=Clathrus columnatus TaxID=1419009 RepID=A0AAV5ANP0_9AGAM|nr:hypothetical protein Clacol_008944 [Clathrus columnatus]